MDNLTGWHLAYERMIATQPEIAKLANMGYDAYDTPILCSFNNPNRLVRLIKECKRFGFILLPTSVSSTLNVLHGLFLEDVDVDANNTSLAIGSWGKRLVPSLKLFKPSQACKPLTLHNDLKDTTIPTIKTMLIAKTANEFKALCGSDKDKKTDNAIKTFPAFFWIHSHFYITTQLQFTVTAKDLAFDILQLVG